MALRPAVPLSRSPDPERSEEEGEAKSLRDAWLTLSMTFLFVILSEAKNLGVPVTRDASLTLSMTDAGRCFANAQHDKREGGQQDILFVSF
jgi:hypothetical protein